MTAPSPFTTLDPAPAGARVVDCRSRLDDPQAGRAAWELQHVPGSCHLDLERDLSGPGQGRHPLPDPGRLAGTLAARGVHPGVPVVVVDETAGPYAARAWWTLRWLGLDDVRVASGGLRAWLAAGRPTCACAGPDGCCVRSEPVGPGIGAWSPSPRHARVAGPQDAAEAADRGHLVDVRERERFLGEREPIDRVAGRVPGAVNHPWATLGSEGIPGLEPEQIVWTCGSGVTACVGPLSAAAAGRPEGRVYVGSWSGWISDPARPIARG